MRIQKNKRQRQRSRAVTTPATATPSAVADSIFRCVPLLLVIEIAHFKWKSAHRSALNHSSRDSVGKALSPAAFCLFRAFSPGLCRVLVQMFFLSLDIDEWKVLGRRRRRVYIKDYATRWEMETQLLHVVIFAGGEQGIMPRKCCECEINRGKAALNRNGNSIGEKTQNFQQAGQNFSNFRIMKIGSQHKNSPQLHFQSGIKWKAIFEPSHKKERQWQGEWMKESREKLFH